MAMLLSTELQRVAVSFIQYTQLMVEGGTNNAANYAIAKPVVLSDGGHSTIYNGVSQGNYVGQSADGGSAAVIGVGKRDGLVERTACSTSNDWNTFVKGTATGGSELNGPVVACWH